MARPVEANGLIEKNGRPEPRAVVVAPSKDRNDRGVDRVSLVSGITGSIPASITTVFIVAIRCP